MGETDGPFPWLPIVAVVVIILGTIAICVAIWAP